MRCSLKSISIYSSIIPSMAAIKRTLLLVLALAVASHADDLADFPQLKGSLNDGNWWAPISATGESMRFSLILPSAEPVGCVQTSVLFSAGSSCFAMMRPRAARTWILSRIA